jgi:hypothetical protein
MQDSDEKWKDLCAQAAVERDPHKLSKLVAEILRLLDERKENIRQGKPGTDPK